jgi:hypothetical protein
MVGQVFSSVIKSGDDELHFLKPDGSGYRFWHYQDCCECVYIESIVGDLSDLEGEPLLRAEESTADARDDVSESGTWTFYKFATRKGYVDVRFLGSSNGYYSESVDVDRIAATERPKFCQEDCECARSFDAPVCSYAEAD